MQINDTTTALVTGANRGLGKHFVTQLRERGATVHATSRRPQSGELRLDVTDPASIATVAEQAPDVNLVINNAGISTYTNLVTGDLDNVRREMETHFFGTLNVIRAFAPTLEKNGGGAILNVLSALSWFNYDGANAYAAAKAAAWSLTGGVRLELPGTQVSGLFLSAADTDMMAGYDGPLLDPAEVVRTALDGLAEGRLEIIADDLTAGVKQALAQDRGVHVAV